MVIGKKAESPRRIAARLGLETEDLLLLNSKAHPALSATTKLKPGTEILTRDRLSEPDVFLPTQKRERRLDDDGRRVASDRRDRPSRRTRLREDARPPRPRRARSEWRVRLCRPAGHDGLRLVLRRDGLHARGGARAVHVGDGAARGVAAPGVPPLGERRRVA